MKGVDAVHLTLKDPDTIGSYNRFIGRQLKSKTDKAQVAICLADGASSSSIIRLHPKGWLNPKLLRFVPKRILATLLFGISEPGHFAYAFSIRAHLQQLRPKVIIAYDLYKLGNLLRTFVDWPCRLILAQRGYSYNLSNVDFRRYCSIKNFDVIWTQTLEAYRYDRMNVHAYEPMLEVVPNSVDTDFFKPAAASKRRVLRHQFGFTESDIVVLIFSRQVAKKGAHLIVPFWNQIKAIIPNAKLWVVGSDKSEHCSVIQSLVPLQSIPDISFKGIIEPHDAPLIYQASDAYLFPTLAAEGMANSLLEAMASGLPCITSEHPGQSELYNDDSSLILVENPNLTGVFVQPLVDLIGDMASARKRGRQAREYILQNYTDDLIMGKLSSFLDRQIQILTQTLT